MDNLISIPEARRNAARLYMGAAWSASRDGERATRGQSMAASFNDAARYARRAADLWVEAGEASDQREAAYTLVLADAWQAAAMRGAA